MERNKDVFKAVWWPPLASFYKLVSYPTSPFTLLGLSSLELLFPHCPLFPHPSINPLKSRVSRPTELRLLKKTLCASNKISFLKKNSVLQISMVYFSRIRMPQAVRLPEPIKENTGSSYQRPRGGSKGKGVIFLKFWKSGFLQMGAQSMQSRAQDQTNWLNISY